MVSIVNFTAPVFTWEEGLSERLPDQAGHGGRLAKGVPVRDCLDFDLI